MLNQDDLIKQNFFLTFCFSTICDACSSMFSEPNIFNVNSYNGTCKQVIFRSKLKYFNSRFNH